MSSTFVEWKGWGFLSRDHYISGAMLLLLEEVRLRRAGNDAVVLERIEQEWSRQIAGQIATCGIDAGLNELLTDNETVGTVVAIMSAVLTKLDEGDCLTTPERMNRLIGDFFSRTLIEYRGDGTVYSLKYERWIIAVLLELIEHVRAVGPAKAGDVPIGNMEPLSHFSSKG